MLKNSVNIGLLTIIVFLVLSIVVVIQKTSHLPFQREEVSFWQMQSIDTVKYSRDVARQFMKNSEFDDVINDHVKKVAETGATHVALGTPYDKEFEPFMKRWVDAARKYSLKIWFRGNFSGWEHWFDYPAISRDDHKKLLQTFILENEDIFEDGDIFTSCTECENGGPGDPRMTGDTEGFRNFLIEEYQIAKSSFKIINKKVEAGYYPMNFDVASLTMDKKTTQALGGYVVIDHYVDTPERTNNDATKIAQDSGGKVIIGEFGAPIPDIHGDMTEFEQARWLEKTLLLLSENTNVIGVNYWTAVGGSTGLWYESGAEKIAVNTIKRFFSPKYIKGYILDETGRPIKDAIIRGELEQIKTNSLGQFVYPYLEDVSTLEITAKGFVPFYAQSLLYGKPVKVIMRAENPGILYNLQKMLYGGIIRL